MPSLSGLPRADEQARTAPAVSSDATAFPVVSTPTRELSQSPLNGISNGVNGLSAATSNGHGSPNLAFPAASNNGLGAANGSSAHLAIGTSEAMSRAASFGPSSTPSRARSLQRSLASTKKGHLHPPVTFASEINETDAESSASAGTSAARRTPAKMVLELADGTAFQGYSFGAPRKSISGECVFQTGKVFSAAFTPKISLQILPPRTPLDYDECFVGTSPNVAPLI